MSRRRLLLTVLLAAAVVPYFVNLGATSIIDANEAFYAETPREMIESGNYISPTFNYEPRLNKPPLSYWVVAAFYRVSGVSLGAARLPIALGAMLILATAFLLGRQAISTDAGLLAAITLAATPRMLLFSRRIIIDVYTAMFVGLTLLFFVLAETEPERRRRWLVAMYVSAALGVLTKGPVAVAIPALVFTVYLVVAGRLRTITRLMLPTGAVVMAAIIVPYYAALHAQQGWGAISGFLLDENLARFAEGVGAPDRGPLFYLPVVFADLYFPWSLLLPAALVLAPWRSVLAGRGWARVWGDATDDGAAVSRERVRLLLGLWIGLIVVFFSLSKGQQDLYVLPFVAAGAALVGGLVDGWVRRAWSSRLDSITTGSAGLAGSVLVVLGVAAVWLVGGTGGRIHLAGAGAAGIAIAAGGVAALVWLLRRTPFGAVASLAAALIVAHWVLVVWALPDFERYKPVPQLARVIQQISGPRPIVGTYLVAAPSLVFYLRQRVTEMFDEGQLSVFLTSDPNALCVMGDEDYDAVRSRIAVPMRVVARAPRFDAGLLDFLGHSPLPDLILVTPATR
jgi:4-amino-4-deoxy-L-arabinose transferase-like glycosyltransferase